MPAVAVPSLTTYSAEHAVYAVPDGFRAKASMKSFAMAKWDRMYAVAAMSFRVRGVKNAEIAAL